MDGLGDRVVRVCEAAKHWRIKHSLYVLGRGSLGIVAKDAPPNALLTVQPSPAHQPADKRVRACEVRSGGPVPPWDKG